MAGNDKRLFKQLSHQDSTSSTGACSSGSSAPQQPSLLPHSSGLLALSPPLTFVGSPVTTSSDGTSPESPLMVSSSGIPSVLVRTVSGSSTQGLSSVDVPQFRDTISNRTLFYLRSTLTASFQPDYDFTDAKSEEFSRVPSIRWVMDAVRTNLSAAAGEIFTAFENKLWMAIDEEIRLSECDVYR